MWKCKRCGSPNKWFDPNLCIDCYIKKAQGKNISRIKIVRGVGVRDEKR